MERVVLAHAMRKLLFGAVAVGSLVSFSGVSLAGTLNRLAADFDFFGFEASTNTTPPGIAVYHREVNVPDGATTLYLTLSTTGDVHNGTGACFTALVDGRFFNPGQSHSACAPGWITLLRESEDLHDNSIYYQWCTAVRPGEREVEIRMASLDEGADVFIEAAHFYVDSSHGPRCRQAPTPDELGPPALQ